MNETPLETHMLSCEREPLHRSGAIQGFGTLLHLNREQRLTHRAANLGEFLPEQANLRPGDTLPPALQDVLAVPLTALPDTPGARREYPALLANEDGVLDAVLSRGPEGIVVEFTRPDDAHRRSGAHRHQVGLLRTPENEHELQAYHQRLADAVREESGFDRVMIYRFHEDWSGEVVAESASGRLGSYLGLHFPASDIPAIARNLYLVNPSRLIPDVAAAPVPLLGLTPEPPDLTWSDLRSVSPVHLQYLTHMGAGASFSIAIKIAGKLWGLVACHHLAPRAISLTTRRHCVDLARGHALGLTAWLAQSRLRFIDALEHRVNRIVETLTHSPDALEHLPACAPALIELTGAVSFALALDDEIIQIGEGLELPALQTLDHVFCNTVPDIIWHTAHLAGEHPELPPSPIAGILAFKGRTRSGRHLRGYWMRPEVPLEVTWAGNPDKPVEIRDGIPGLSPRHSFEKWVEIKRGLAPPWNNEARMVALRLRGALIALL